jgi:acyl carrier protein
MLAQSTTDRRIWVMSTSSFMQPATAINVRNLIAEQLGVDAKRVSDEAHFLNDLGADWLDRLELMIVIEDHYGIEIADDVVDKIVAVGDLMRFIEAHGHH